MNYIRWFKTLDMDDIPLVGGKNASIGQMIQALHKEGITIPDGFAITSQAYWHYITFNELMDPLRKILAQLNPKNISSIQKTGEKIRHHIQEGKMPPDLAEQIEVAYYKLCRKYDQKNCDVAVRSSATAEDLPTASFAGQQETFLNIRGVKPLLTACKKSLASLFTDRAIIYRIQKGFDHFNVALSIGIQKMVRADKACSGVAFSLDTESGFKDVVMIDAAWGLGESIVKGIVNPDEYYVFKPTLLKGYNAIIKKECGTKKVKIIYGKSWRKPTKKVNVSKKNQKIFCLTDRQVRELAHMVITIENYYSKRNNRWTPMDIEWAIDGIDGKLYIVQARPETIHAQSNQCIYKIYSLNQKDLEKRIVCKGLSIGSHVTVGRAAVITSIKDINKVKKGDIIVTTMTDPDWVPVMKKAGGIITDLGGRTCHAAIVSRELGTPAIVGVQDATKKIKNNQLITLDCSQGAIGFVYDGEIPFSVREIDCQKVPRAPVKVMVNIANPDSAFQLSRLPVEGVGLARIEFIISNSVKIHPMALIDQKKVTNKKVKKSIETITHAYPTKTQFFVDKLAQGIGMIAAAFYPKPVIVRLSDFKTNEYSNLIGGSYFEQQEANPMIGFRGASRYINPLYQQAFCLECAALLKARNDMGLDNILLMVPFVRTIDEARHVIQGLAHCGLKREKKGLKIVMMCEVPSNVIMIDAFSQLFDGFSIGSNDLTQLTLGVDRDSALLAHMFDERDDAVKQMFVMAIDGAHRNNKFIGICGQAPSDYPELAEFLIKKGIDSISLNPDSVLPFLMQYKNKR